MQRISLVRALLLSSLTTVSLLCPLVTGTETDQQYQRTTAGDVVIADMDDFLDYLYTEHDEDYSEEDKHRIYRQGNNESYPFVLDDDDYKNPVYNSFIDVSPQNPLGRDSDELPDTPGDKGREPNSGDFQWLLISTFIEGQTETGKVWAAPADSPEDAYALIVGLERPNAICFDPNHDFLYVCDSSQGVIYQYVVDWDDDDRFIISSDVVTRIISNANPQSCAIDAYGNLYYTDTDSINVVAYLDLWGGYEGQNRVLYEGGDLMDGPKGLDVYRSRRIYYVNSRNTGDAGLLNMAPTRSETTRIAVREDRIGRDVAVSPEYAYFTDGDGSVWAYRFQGRANLFLKSSGVMKDPRGVCYSDGKVYVADFSQGLIYRLHDSNDEETPSEFLRLEDSFALECVMVDYDQLTRPAFDLLSHGFCYSTPLGVTLQASKSDLSLTTKAKTTASTASSALRLTGKYQEALFTLQSSDPTEWLLRCELQPEQSPLLKLAGEIGCRAGSLQVRHSIDRLHYSVSMTKGPVLAFKGLWNGGWMGVGAAMDYDWVSAQTKEVEVAAYAGNADRRLVLRYQLQGRLRMSGYLKLTDKVTVACTAEHRPSSSLSSEAGLRLVFSPNRSMTLKFSSSGLFSYVSRLRLWQCLEAVYSVQVSTGKSEPAGLQAGLKLKITA